MSKREDSQTNWLAIGMLLGSILGGLSAKGHYQHQEAETNARWEAVTGSTLEEAETNLKQCQRGARCRSTLLIEVYGVKGSVR